MDNPMDFPAFLARFGLSLNPQQQDAARRTRGHTLLLAVPGSGKTAVLIARAGYLIAGCGVPPGAVLTMSYNVSAVQDLRQRFAAQFGAAVPAPEFRTVHGFCAVVLADYARLTGKTLFRLMDKPGENARLLSQIALETLHMRPSDLQLRELQRKLSVQRNRMDDNGSAGLHDFLRVYTERKIALRAMDYDDLLEYAFRALTAHPSLLAAYRRRFLYVQVDEAQDLSPLQHKIIDCIAQTGSLMMVGDEDQSIYGFRAANPDALFSFSTQYPDAKVMTLTQNYRSTPEIVRAANGLIARNTARHPKQMCTARPGGPAPQRVCVRSRIAQYALLESMAAAARCQTAFLYRNNDSALPLIDLLTAHGIPFFCREHDISYFNQPKIADFCAMLRFVRQMGNPALFRELYHKWGVPIPRAAMEATLPLHARTPEKDLPAVLIASELLDETATIQLRTQYRQWKRIARMKSFDALLSLRNDTAFGKRFSANSDVRLEPLLALAAQNPDADRFAARLETLRTQIRAGFGALGSPIVLSTLHAAKGLEFDRVVLFDVYDGVLPAAVGSAQSAAQQLEEDRRLFYVGVTRARNELLVLEYGNGKNRVSSQFVDELFRDPENDLPPDSAFRSGVRVVHRKYGPGQIVDRQKSIISVRFDDKTLKKADLRVCLPAGLILLEK